MTRDLSPFEQRLLKIIEDLNRCTLRPVPTRTIADLAGGIPVSTTRRLLSSMEKANAITRITPKTGWVLPNYAA
jgi:DNA-binding IclR family transcriptional regulator